MGDTQLKEKVLVVGGGIGGICAATDLAQAGRDVVLIDNAVSIGGLLARLDRTFPTNNCDLGTLQPYLAADSRQQRIKFHTMTEITDVTGKAGNFTVTLTTSPRHINVERCTACGKCLEKFPDCVSCKPGLNYHAQTCMRYPKATPQAFSIDMDKCTDKNGLVKSCPENAILVDDAEKCFKEEFTAIILAPGADTFDPSAISTLGYTKYPDMVTNLEYEQLLSASGPTGGQLIRPSDGKRPSKIAWIQCVGSRERNKHSAAYCSSVCCMIALKEAMITREWFNDKIEMTVFYMDIRALGKNYELYYQRAKNEYGVRFIRCRTQNIIRDEEANALSIAYIPEQEEKVVSENYDMVVLSTGFRISKETEKLAGKLGIKLNEHGFAETDPFNPVATSKPGIYVCGLFESPKDIPGTIIQASAAASMAAGNVSYAGTKDSKENLPPERDVSNEEPRIGLFICDCGEDVGECIDLRDLAKECKTLPHVEICELLNHSCSAQSLEYIQELIVSKRINRLVIGGCSPRTYETVFQDLLRRSGLNGYLLEIADIRDQAMRVHRDKPEEILKKAGQLIRMAVASVKCANALNGKFIPINKDALVVGGGVAGMTAAADLADKGFSVHLIEKTGALGGEAKNIRKILTGEDIPAVVNKLTEEIESHKNIQVIKEATIVDHSGTAGMFRTGLQTGPEGKYLQIKHGVTILATGSMVNKPREYLLGEHDSVLTQHDIDSLIEDHPDKIKTWKTAVMIQCVGSRIPENPNCSRICCTVTIKNILRIFDINPELRIFVLYRDMRTTGFSEVAYSEARRRGAIFVPYREDEVPKVAADGEQIRISFNDPILNSNLTLKADQLILSTGFSVDKESNKNTARIFKLPLTEDGFFLEDHVKLRPVDLPVPGFFISGTAHGPKLIPESIVQGHAAAARACTILTKDEIDTGVAVAYVDENKCATCLVCFRICSYGAPHLNKNGFSEIDPYLCRGCGACTSQCPAKAIHLNKFEDERIFAKLDGVFERTTV